MQCQWCTYTLLRNVHPAEAYFSVHDTSEKVNFR